ncbi:MAG: L-threonylcarbamoyladenylate synthase, partial [Candidatus Nanopelagicales bacterium]
QPTLAWDLGGSSGTVSLRMPLHPVALDVLNAAGPLAVTGAHAAGDVPPRTCDEAEEKLGEEVALYLDAGPCAAEQPSAIVDLTGDVPVLLREGAFDFEALRAVCPELIRLET